MTEIYIDITSEEIAIRKDKLEKARRFETIGRIPVTPWVDNRYFYEKIGTTMKSVFNDPVKLLEAQLFGQKWVLENIKSDHCEISVQNWSWFENVREASALGCEIDFPSPNQVWIKKPWIESEKDLVKLSNIDFIKSGLHGREIKFRDTIRKISKNYKVRLKDGFEFYPAGNTRLIADMDGPFTLASEIRGFQRLMEDIVDRPDFVKKLVDIIAEKEIEWVDYCKRVDGDDSTIWIGDDYVQFLSPDMYEEFALPYEKKIRFHFGGYCMFHLCGHSEHLLNYLVKDLKIDEFSGFGFQLNKKKVMELMGGKIILVGNISPINLLNGTKETIVPEIIEAIKIFGPTKGYILTDGADIAPGTPVENINLMYETAINYNESYFD